MSHRQTVCTFGVFEPLGNQESKQDMSLMKQMQRSNIYRIKEK